MLIRMRRTIEIARKIFRAAAAYRRLSALRGKVTFSIDLETMRHDRD